MNLADYVMLPKHRMLVAKSAEKRKFYALGSESSSFDLLYKGLLTVEQYLDFIDLLIEGRTIDGNRNVLDPASCYNLAEDILEIGSSLRQELLRVSETRGIRSDKFDIETRIRAQIRTMNNSYLHNNEYIVSDSWGESEFAIMKVDSRGIKLWLNHHPFGQIYVREVVRTDK